MNYDGTAVAMGSRRMHTATTRLGALMVALGLSVGVAHASPGTWSNASGPSGYSGQLSVMRATTRPRGVNTVVIGGGLNAVFTAPLARPLVFTALPSAGLGLPWALVDVVPTASGAAVLAVFNFRVAGTAPELRYLDPATHTWMRSGPASLTWVSWPRLALTHDGSVLASLSDAIYASTDEGATFALRTRMADHLAAPAPMPAGGGAVGYPGYGTNAVTGAYAGYSETFNVMPWGEVFLGTETLAEWHSYDDGRTWEHVDPLWREPQRDMAGVPLYASPFVTFFGRNGNTAGAGATRDGDVIVECDGNGGENFFRFTETGLVALVEQRAVNLPLAAGGTLNLGQVKHFHTLRSGDTLTAPTRWDPGNVAVPPVGRNVYEMASWDGAAVTLTTPAAGASWVPNGNDGSDGATDGDVFYALSQASSNNLMVWTPERPANQRPTVTLTDGAPVVLTLDAVTGRASWSPASRFEVSDDGVPGTGLRYTWAARGHGPVVFDRPDALDATAHFDTPGWYVLTLGASDGVERSGNAVRVQVLAAAGGSAPVITAQPVNQSLTVGSSATVRVTATGAGLAYRWYRNGVELCDGASYAGAATATLTVRAPTARDRDAMFYCRVSNAFGRAVSNAATLGGAPVIVGQPLSQTVPAGAMATLGVAATGTQPLRWRWYVGAGAARVPVATGGTQGSLQTSAPGVYSVEVTNAFGAVTSATATVANGPASTFSLNLQPGNGTSASGGGTYALTGGRAAAIAIGTDLYGSGGTRFVTWRSGAPAGVTVSFADASEPHTTMSVTGVAPGQAVTVYAMYDRPAQVPLAVINGTGNAMTGVHSMRPGERVEVSAYAAPPGMRFDRWVGAPVDGSTSPTVSFAMPATVTRIAARYSGVSVDAGLADAAAMAPDAAAMALDAAGMPLDAVGMAPDAQGAMDPAGCGCRVPRSSGNRSVFGGVWLALGAVLRRRRRGCARG